MSVHEVWECPMLRHNAWEYAEIKHAAQVFFVDDRIEKLMIFSYGQPKGKYTSESKSYKVNTMFVMSNVL